MIFCFAAADAAVFLASCDKQQSEEAASAEETTISANQNPSASDRDEAALCITCNDLEWRIFCQKKCGVSGASFDEVMVRMTGAGWFENKSCCTNTYSSTITASTTNPSSNAWEPINPRLLKSSVYPGCGATTNAKIRVFATMNGSEGPFRLPGSLQIQIRKKGDTSGATLTQHFVNVNPDLQICNAGTHTGQYVELPITIDDNCRIISQHMVPPDPPGYNCPIDNGGGGGGGEG